MTTESSAPGFVPPVHAAPKWQPLNSRQRRVAGVLIEKAKTVPDSYPMTLNSIVNGCNQKSNRDPHLELTEEDVEQVIEELRGMGAVVELQGSGRALKYKHNLYDWLGVDKVEIAVMAELLLRGEQTIGELRGRAARMEPIADLPALQPVLKSLIEKKLVLELTAGGRGQLVTHNLYKDRELTELRAHYAAHPPTSSPDRAEVPRTPAAAPRPASFTPGVTSDMFAELRVEVAELRAEVARLRNDVRELRDAIGS